MMYIQHNQVANVMLVTPARMIIHEWARQDTQIFIPSLQSPQGIRMAQKAKELLRTYEFADPSLAKKLANFDGSTWTSFQEMMNIGVQQNLVRLIPNDRPESPFLEKGYQINRPKEKPPIDLSYRPFVSQLIRASRAA